MMMMMVTNRKGGEENVCIFCPTFCLSLFYNNLGCEAELKLIFLKVKVKVCFVAIMITDSHQKSGDKCEHWP